MTVAIGKMYENLYKLPGGEALVRGMSRNAARLAFYNPLAGLKKKGFAPGDKSGRRAHVRADGGAPGGFQGESRSAGVLGGGVPLPMATIAATRKVCAMP
jgi:hypothetical protein